jgi:hypothetical protein
MQNNNNSRSQPNLYNGPLPAQFNVGVEDMSHRLGGGLSQGHIANFNRSSIELGSRSRSRSPIPRSHSEMDGIDNYGGEQQR